MRLAEHGRSVQQETGLDNSNVLQPIDSVDVPYTLVNHCRWERLRDIVPALILKPSLVGFVLRIFAGDLVHPDPIFYRLHWPTGTLAETAKWSDL